MQYTVRFFIIANFLYVLFNYTNNINLYRVINLLNCNIKFFVKDARRIFV